MPKLLIILLIICGLSCQKGPKKVGLLALGSFDAAESIKTIDQVELSLCDYCKSRI